MFLDIDNGNPRMQDEPREPTRKGARFATMENTREHEENEHWRLVEGKQNWASRIRTSGISDGHLRQYSGESGK